MKSFIEFAKTPFAVLLGIAAVLAVLTWLFLGLAKDHHSALDICTGNGGSYNALTLVCTLPDGTR